MAETGGDSLLRAPVDRVFRAEALEYHSGGQPQGELLIVVPGWVRWTYALLLALVSTTSAFLVFGYLPRYAEGIAIVREKGTDTTDTHTVIAVFPSDARPFLIPGRLIRVEFSQSAYGHSDVSIDRLDAVDRSGNEVELVVGAPPAFREAGSGSFVVAYGTLTSQPPPSRAHFPALRDGMRGVAHVATHYDRLLDLVWPNAESTAVLR